MISNSCTNISILNELLFQQDLNAQAVNLSSLSKYMLVIPERKVDVASGIPRDTNFKSKRPYQPEDQIFWCVFRHVYPDEESNIMRFKNRELEEKVTIVEWMKKTPACLKQMKITKQSTQEIMGDIMTNTKCTLFSLHALAMYYKIRVIVLDPMHKMYIEYCDPASVSAEDEMTTCLIERFFQNGKESFRTGSDIDYKTLFLKQHTYEKTLRAISSYKSSDLDEIVRITLFDKSSQPKWTKPLLYEALLIWLARIPTTYRNNEHKIDSTSHLKI